MRRKIFISHANPEDNEFSLWLALQLAKEGYPVWCDLTKLLGGEDFWTDIENAIREKTIKFLYVLSHKSNSKAGSRKELKLADTVSRELHDIKDFIIPLKFDDLPTSQINILLSQLNAVRFDKGWANGLSDLLEKLETDDVPKAANFNAGAVTSWWRTQFSATRNLKFEEDIHLSDWFSITSMPEKIYYHSLSRKGIGKIEVSNDLVWPAFQEAVSLISFANKSDLAEKLDKDLVIVDSRSFNLNHYLDNDPNETTVVQRQIKKHVVRLLNLAWAKGLASRGLPVKHMANNKHCYYFPNATLPENKIRFVNIEGKKKWRAIAGYSQAKNRYWHFGIHAWAMLAPVQAYLVKSHVLFSSDGRNIWDSDARLHRARRSHCKNWWNDEWRDRLLATLSWCAGDEDQFRISVAPEVDILVSPTPETFLSPVKYIGEAEKVVWPDEEDESENGIPNSGVSD